MSINASPQDLVVGLDFTGLASASGADLNNGVDLAKPSNAGDDTIGAALILTTTDTALDIPDVPNPATSADYTKWKRYQWNRRPFAGATIKNVKCYQWNDDAAADATLLKWLETFVDTADIEAIANNALATANNAVSIANNASTIATNANTTANTASAAVAAATLAANNAATLATAAQTTATAAQTTANTAQTTANQALFLAPKQSLYSKFSETKPKGTDAGASAAGKNTRVLNTVDYAGTTAQVSLNVLTGIMTITDGGYYWIEAEATMFDNSDNQHQLFIVDDVSNTNLLTGFSLCFVAGGATAQRSKVCGLVLFTDGQTFRLDHYIANVQAANGLGKAANVNPDAAGKEVYSTLYMFPIGGD